MSDSLDRLRAALADRYRIERELGQGGMATVYLAHDIKHDRKVALKVLKPELAAVIGAERFIVEIKTTAALQHPHILPLFDSGTADSFLYYVMPYVEGETLRQKLDRETQFGIDEAVKIATDVLDALDYAHRHGVVHRDIKPENILLQDGRPMVADFGIALALSAAAGGRMTETGLSLGTPHYMSPEQATAEKEITGRSDVYSLGSVLYEMLTGNPPHVGSSAQQIIMKIITETAQPVIAHRKSVPRNVAAAVAKALEKLPSDRFESAKAFADALSNPSFQYGDALTSVAGARGHAVRYRDPVTVGLGVFALIATAAALLAMMRPAPPQLVGKYAIALDSTAQLAYRGIGEPARVALTPDGSTVIYVSSRAGRFSALDELLVRPLGSLESRALPGTLGASRPAVSPDGSQVAFLAGPADHASLVVVPLGGGPPLTLADSAIASGPAWGPKGFIFYVTRTGIIRRVAATGGPTEDVVRLPALSGAANYRWLTILPGGHAAIVGIRPGSPTDDAQYLLRSVDFATGQLGATLSGIAAHYVAEARALIYVAPDGSLMAVPFDVSHQKLKGRPQALFTGVSARNGEADLDVAGGMLVYALPGQNGVEHMAWVSRKTGIAQTVDSTWTDTEFESFALSPDGGRLAVTIGGGVATDKSNQSRYDVWLKQLDHGPMSRLSFGGESNTDPSWSGDGKYVSYTSLRGGYGSLWRRRADGVGEEELVADIGRNIIESRWSRDGAWLVVSVSGPPSRDIMAMHLGVDRALRPLLAEAHDEWKPSISPNGQWLAYVSTESGTEQVFVRPFPNVQAGKWQISLSGGTDPVWSADGRELFFRALSRNREPQVLVAELSKGPGLADLRVLITSPRGFEVNPQDRMFDVSPDAQRFMVSVQENDDETGNLVVVHNFIAELRAALASGRAKQ